MNCYVLTCYFQSCCKRCGAAWDTAYLYTVYFFFFLCHAKHLAYPKWDYIVNYETNIYKYYIHNTYKRSINHSICTILIQSIKENVGLMMELEKI